MPVTTVGTTGAQLAPMDPYRTSLHVENRSVAAVIYIARMNPEGITTSNAEHRIAGNEFVDITEREDGLIVHDRWSVISDTAATTFSVDQGYRIGPPPGILAA